MQKLISSVLLLISLFLLLTTMADAFRSSLRALPPFCAPASINGADEKRLTGKDFSAPSVQKTPDTMYAKSYCLFDAETGRTLLGKNENEQLPMASTTKIMTCILALENAAPDSRVTVSAYAASMPDVQLNMQTGDSFFLKDLLYSLMLESHNDTAVAIAEHIGGSVEGFAAMMNAKADELGCTDTHFVTPNGLDAADHYTTARELCIIAAYAIKNNDFLQIIQTSSHQFSNCDGSRTYSVYNHDAFLTSYSGAIGIKTGFTSKAGYCFCGAAKRDGKTLISSVLACGWPPNKNYKWSDTKKLMDYGFRSFRQVIVEEKKTSGTLPIKGGTKNSITFRQSDTSDFPLMLCENDTIRIRYNLPSTLNAPVRKGDIIGYREYYLNSELIRRSPVTAGESIKKRNFSYYAAITLKLFFQSLH